MKINEVSKHWLFFECIHLREVIKELERRLGNPWVCTYCKSRYAEYINGCPKCYLGEAGTSSSVVLVAPFDPSKKEECRCKLCDNLMICGEDGVFRCSACGINHEPSEKPEVVYGGEYRFCDARVDHCFFVRLCKGAEFPQYRWSNFTTWENISGTKYCHGKLDTADQFIALVESGELVLLDHVETRKKG